MQNRTDYPNFFTAYASSQAFFKEKIMDSTVIRLNFA